MRFDAVKEKETEELQQNEEPVDVPRSILSWQL